MDIVGVSVDANAKADEMMDAYIAQTGATVIAGEVSSKELLGLYFDAQPPFGRRNTRVPDAIALALSERYRFTHDLEVAAATTPKAG